MVSGLYPEKVTMKNKGLILFFLSIVLFFAALSIRLYKVGNLPSGMLVDEVSHGYNAYSILKTGKDEYGVSYPLVFRAFGDQKLPLYIYLIVPSIKIFGLSALSVRFPSVLAGSLLPVVIFFLLLELGFKRRISFFGGVITIVSPWMVILSRFGYETNMGLLFFSLGILFTFMSSRKKSLGYSMLSGVCFGLTLYSYIAFRFITPFIILILFSMSETGKKIVTKYKLFLIVTFVIMLIPLSSALFKPQSTARFSQAGSGYTTGLKMEIDENRTFCSDNLPKLLCYATSNKIVFMARSYLYRYIDAFSPGYLFLTGDNKDTSFNVDNFGQFYVWLLPFYLLGLFSLIDRLRSRRFTPVDVFVCIGMLIAATPSLLVGDAHKLRLSALYPFIIILISFGISQLELYIKRKIYLNVLYVGLYTLSLLSCIFFLVLFLAIHIQKYEITYLRYRPILMKYLGKNESNKQIYINSITEGIIFYAFFNQIDPAIYQKNIIRKSADEIGFTHSSDLLNVHITEQSLREVLCRTRKNEIPSLYVTNENIKEIPNVYKKIISTENGVHKLAIIYDLKAIDETIIHCE